MASRIGHQTGKPFSRGIVRWRFPMFEHRIIHRQRANVDVVGSGKLLGLVPPESLWFFMNSFHVSHLTFNSSCSPFSPFRVASPLEGWNFDWLFHKLQHLWNDLIIKPVYFHFKCRCSRSSLLGVGKWTRSICADYSRATSLHSLIIEKLITSFCDCITFRISVDVRCGLLAKIWLQATLFCHPNPLLKEVNDA